MGKRKVLLLLLAIGFLNASALAESINQNTQDAMSGNGMQSKVSAADLARNAATCKPPYVIWPCLLIPLDIASILGAMKSKGKNQDADNHVDTSGIDALMQDLANAGLDGGNSSLQAFNNVCSDAPDLCRQCDDSDDERCQVLDIPDAVLQSIQAGQDALANLPRGADGKIDPEALKELGLDESIAEQEGIEDLIEEAFADLEGNVAGINDIVGGLQAGAAGDSEVAGTGLGGDGKDLKDLESDLIGGSGAHAIGRSLRRFNKDKHRDVQIKRGQLEDAVDGSLLSIWDRATRRYQGTEDFKRAFHLAKTELKRKRMLKQEIRKARSSPKAEEKEAPKAKVASGEQGAEISLLAD